MQSIKINKKDDFKAYEKLEKLDYNIEINCELEANNLKSVGGYLSINYQAKLDNLKSVGGDLSIYCFIGLKLEKKLFKWNKNNLFRVTDKCSEWLLTQKEGKVILVALEGTQEGYNVQAKQIHLDCIDLWYNSQMNIIYQKVVSPVTTRRDKK